MKRSSSALAATIMITLGGIGMTAAQMLSPIVPQAQAAYCQNQSFTARIVFSPTRVRSQPNTQSGVVKQLQPGTVQFSTFVYGETIADAWTGQPDNKWFKLADGSGYVASAVVAGYPPNTCTDGGGGGEVRTKADQFFNWANGQWSISRRDPNTSGLNGQCVSLVVRYLQDVFFNQSSASVAYGHGKDVANGVANKVGNYFEPVTLNGLPKRGAIVSFRGATPYYAQWGHVAIVLDANNNAGRQALILESNADGNAPNTKVQARWVNLDSYAGGTVGWTNPKF
ncbi:CHAP domain-containing protein [Leptolyngbya sp. AN03gr2]|uniref:CHAP domain-containing protein n=1 Tax=unclassified Leptolyngbya TaxID=2650499 RepID=UPI003D320501